MTFHDLSEFSMTKVKQFVSQQYQNNHLFDILPSTCACVNFSEIKACVQLVRYFSIFKTSFCQAYCFCMTFHDLHLNSMTFQVLHHLYEPCIKKSCTLEAETSE